MDLQFYGANCVSLNVKGVRLVVDDNLANLGAKSVTKADDVQLVTNPAVEAAQAGRLIIDGPGEYEVADVSIIGIAARAHTDEEGQRTATMFKVVTSEASALVTGHVYPELSEAQLEAIGMVDLMIVPVGGNGYTVDPVGVLKLVKEVEPKVIVPTHYADKDLKLPVPQQSLADALKELGMEAKETTAKLKYKPGEASDVTQLIVLEKS
ncbi:MAG TPA: MBL fold metallo-hydrolase [Candidatus Saccharimonadales bacterium]|nr:MBL fold metallo-hydrolase [Candidatus Saccharimonadales bacterium]